MKGIAKSIRKAVAVTSAFQSKLVEAENNMHETIAEEFNGRRTLNLGGLEVPLIEGELKDIEKIFLKAAANGDATSVKRLIENAKSYQLNVNCMDTMGRGVLRIAIEAEHIELLQMLLGYEQIELKDCLLHAINEEDVQAVELILQAQSERSHKKNLQGLLGHIQSSSFTPDITPLILAAHRDNYIIVKLLLDRGNQIAKPHEPRCACNACVQANREDSLQYSKHRINAYKALASPCFISLSSKDPILTAFELSSELKRLGDLENEFREDYEQLSIKCQEFATALLEQTRGSAELAIVLNYHTGSSDAYEQDAIYMPCGADGQRMKLSRLKLAIKYKQKKFVAHPHCQQLLASLWYEGLPGFRRKHVSVQVATITIICLLFPIICTCYLIAPESHIGNMLHKPFIKFLCQSSAYVSFLALLTLIAIRIEYIVTDTIEDRMSRRDPPASVIECIVIIYIFGFVWQQITRIWKSGLRAYAMDMWNLLDFVQNSLYMCTIALRGVAIMRVHLYKEPAILNRAQWNAYDPVLISECLFAIANIFATLRLIYVFTVSPQLGPLQISLGRMVNDILKFFCVFSLVMVAFAFGFNQLFWFYANTRFNRCKDVPFSLEEGKREVYEYCKTTGRYFTK
ncbi:unnamed protein product [Schistocephalus solidus]|uniref:ANK_REP_REGION domain-containing protein n=1 Tax=Schistocephalus solidus TaxID=70667 RepID=A0A183S7K9_SCHSO|nr:unnamed protein product [Schistocephalus solidus]